MAATFENQGNRVKPQLCLLLHRTVTGIAPGFEQRFDVAEVVGLVLSAQLCRSGADADQERKEPFHVRRQALGGWASSLASGQRSMQYPSWYSGKSTKSTCFFMAVRRLRLRWLPS